MPRKKTDKVTAALREVERAARRLEPEQGAIARKNARTATLAALRKFRKQLDATYPHVATKKRKKPPQTAAGKLRARRERLRKRGYVRLTTPSNELIRRCAYVGISIERVRGPKAGDELWAPLYVFGTNSDHTLKTAKKSGSLRKALRVKAELLAEEQGWKDWTR